MNPSSATHRPSLSCCSNPVFVIRGATVGGSGVSGRLWAPQYYWSPCPLCPFTFTPLNLALLAWSHLYSAPDHDIAVAILEAMSGFSFKVASVPHSVASAQP